MNSSSRYSPVWMVLLVVPSAVASILLAPSSLLSTWGEGLLAEWLGVHLIGSPEYLEFAKALLMWTVVALLMAFIIALVIWYLLERDWPERLRRFEVRSVLGYQRMVVTRMASAFAGGLVVAVLASAVSPEIRGMPLVSTLAFIAIIAVFGAAQFLTAVLAFENTNRLFFGR
jgi:putative flippase GtrA